MTYNVLMVTLNPTHSLTRLRYVIGMFSCVQDTLLALESLTEFSYRQTNRAFYNLQLEFDCTSNSSWTQTVKLDRTNFANLFTFDVRWLC